MTNPIDEMLAMQRELQTIIAANGDVGASIVIDPEAASPTHRMATLRTQVLATLDEVHEALNETGWKPWAKSQHFNREAFQGELIDAWHFFMNLMMMSGMTADTMMDLYRRKWQVNIDRQRAKYDGVTTKCPVCKAAYDDVSVRCTPADPASPSPRFKSAWCAKRQHHHVNGADPYAIDPKRQQGIA